MSIISVEILKKNIPFYDILKNIEENYNAKIYIVGGCIRDILLNIPLHDIDITAENIEYTYLAKMLGKHLKAYAVSFKDNMRIMKNNLIIDISNLRGSSIYEDVQKRDFTINNLACSLEGSIIGSDDDINNKIIRLVYDEAFDDDAIRIIRAFRFSSSLGFEIDKDTLNIAYQKRNLIKKCAKERILEELRKMFQGKYLEKALNYISEYNIFDIFFDVSKIDNKKLLSAHFITSDFALLLSLWCKDYNFIEFLGLTAKEYKQINEYLKIDYNNLKSSDDNALKYFIFTHADLIKNIIIYIKINYNDDILADKLSSLYNELDFNKSKAVNGGILLSLGFKPSPLFSEIINQVSFLLAINELNKDNIEEYIKNRWC